VHQFLGADRHDMIAVDDLAVFVTDYQSIAVTVQGKTDIRPNFLHSLGHDLRMQGAAVLIDISAVRFDPELRYLGPQLLKDVGRHPVGGTVGAVEDDMKTVQGVLLREGVFQKYYISPLGIFDPRGLADFFCHWPEGRHLLGKDKVFNIQLHFIRQFKTVAGKYFDAVILKRIVGGGDDDTGISSH